MRISQNLDCISCLSKQFGDVKNDDVTSGSMVPDVNVGKILVDGKELRVFTSLSEVFPLSRFGKKEN